MLVRMKIAAIFLLIYCYKHLQSNGHKSENSSLNALLQLMSLTEYTCKFIDWCSVRKQGDIGVNKGSSIWCCPSCSCKSTCLRDKTCCPDFELSLFLGGREYSNLVNLVAELGQSNFSNVLELVAEQRLTNYSKNFIELAAELNQTNYSEVLDIAAEMDQTNNSDFLDLAAEFGQTKDFNNIEYINPILKQSTKCVLSSILGSRRRPSLESMYMMVSKCSESSVTPDIEHKCERLAKFSPGSTIKDYVPVQSLASGNVYRNINCFRCSNETTARYAEWDTIWTSVMYPQRYLQNQMSSIEELFALEYLLISNKQGKGWSNIRFEPNDSLRNAYPPSKCHVIDVNRCNGSGTNASKVLQYACQQYVLPVHRNVKDTRVVFNNLACVYCNGLVATHTDLETICEQDSHLQNATLFLGIINDKYAENFGKMDVSVNGTINNEASGLKSTRCKKGYVYDNTNTCRKLYCPGGMIEYGDTCVPIFGTIQGKVYDVQLTVILADWTTEEKNSTHFELELLNYINKFFEIGSRFTIQYLTLWRSGKKFGHKVDYFVKVCFAGLDADITYLEVVTMIGKAFRGTKVVTTKPVHSMVDISFNDVITIGQDAVDIISNRIYKLVYPSAKPTLPPFHSLLPITEGNFCYWIEVLPSDIAERKGRNVILKYTRKIILLTNVYNSLLNNSRHFVCAEHVLGKKTVTSLNRNIDNKKADTTEEENRDIQHEKVYSENIEKMISLTTFLGCIIICFGAIICVKRHPKHRVITGQQNTNEIELASVNN